MKINKEDLEIEHPNHFRRSFSIYYINNSTLTKQGLINEQDEIIVEEFFLENYIRMIKDVQILIKRGLCSLDFI